MSDEKISPPPTVTDVVVNEVKPDIPPVINPPIRPDITNQPPDVILFTKSYSDDLQTMRTDVNTETGSD